MKHFKSFIVSFLIYQVSFGQDQPLFDKNTYQHDSCAQQLKALIEKQTDFKFNKHPLEWAQQQIDSNLLRSDTLFNNEQKNRTIYYFNRSNSLFLIRTTSTELKNWSKKISVYDDSGNLLLRESYLESGPLVFRKRRGYFESYIQFECNYYDTPLYRFNMFSKNGKIVKPNVDVCECNF